MTTNPDGLAARLWTYQKERFPLAKTVPLLLAFSASSVTASAHLAGRGMPGMAAYAVAFLLVLGFFWQMRVADEHKDAETDRLYRPERPIPRGLVSFLEIGALAVVSVGVSVTVAVAFHPMLVVLVMAAWFWLAMMTAEFFAPKVLHASPVLYLASHMLIMPLIDLVLTACEWLPAGSMPPGMWTFLLMSLANGCVIEFGRKVWAPANERPGVETYSGAWGIPRACEAVYGAWLLAYAALVAYGAYFGMAAWFSAAGTAAGLPLLLAVHSFETAPTPERQKRIETLSGVWVLACYALAGLLPFLGGN